MSIPSKRGGAMYATTQTGFPMADSERPPDLQRLVDAVAGQPGCVRAYGLRPIGATSPSPITSLIALWRTEHDARRYVALSRDDRVGTRAADLIYEVRVRSRRPDPGGTAHLLGYLH
jgi:hypothetical protein